MLQRTNITADADPPTSDPPRPFAIIFRTHFWDEFTRRQLQRLAERTKHGHIHVLVDDTSRRVEGIKHDRIVRVTEQQMLEQGFAAAGEGNLFWFNGDYPLYHFRALHREYAYYLQLEYDVVLNLDLDALIARIAADQADFVGLSKGEPPLEWPWVYSMGGYAPQDIRHQLICVSVFSGRALDLLARRRLEQAEARRTGTLATWPMCEGFVATELPLNGMVVRELSDYGGTDFYDHWPPYIETDLSQLAGQAFVHPVLDRARYIGSVLKYPVGLAGFLNPNSVLHKKLRRLPPWLYVRTLASAFAHKVAKNVRIPRAVRAASAGS